MSQLQLVGFLGLVAIAACWALAVLLYRVLSAELGNFAGLFAAADAGAIENELQAGSTP